MKLAADGSTCCTSGSAATTPATRSRSLRNVAIRVCIVSGSASVASTASEQGVENAYGGRMQASNSMMAGAASADPQRTPASPSALDRVRRITTLLNSASKSRVGSLSANSIYAASTTTMPWPSSKRQAAALQGEIDRNVGGVGNDCNTGIAIG